MKYYSRPKEKNYVRKDVFAKYVVKTDIENVKKGKTERQLISRKDVM